MTTPGGGGQALDNPPKPADNVEHSESSSLLSYTHFLQQAAKIMSSPPSEGELQPGQAMSRSMDINALNKASRLAQDGPLHQFSYDAARQDLPPSITSTFRDNYGNPLTQVRIPVDNNGNYRMSEYLDVGKNQVPNRTEMQNNVRVENGQILYQRQPQDLGDVVNQIAFGRTWLKAGDLESSKQHFLELADKHGSRGNVESYINMMIRRNHQRKIDNQKHPDKKVKYATDDQMASALRSLSSMYETKRTGTATSLSDATINKRVIGTAKLLGDPDKINDQGSLPSCCANSMWNIAIYTHPESVAKAEASIYTKGEFKGARYKVDELNQDRYWNQPAEMYALTSWSYKKARGSDFTLTPKAGGHRTDNAQTGYRMVTGEGLPMTDADYARTGFKMQITMGGAHMQNLIRRLDHKTDRYYDYMANWHYGMGEGRV